MLRSSCELISSDPALMPTDDVSELSSSVDDCEHPLKAANAKANAIDKIQTAALLDSSQFPCSICIAAIPLLRPLQRSPEIPQLLKHLRRLS